MYDGLKNLEVPRTARPGLRRAVKVTVVGMLVLGLIGAGGYAYVFKRVNDNLKKGVIELEEIVEALPDDPLNILVIGSDSRAENTKADRRSGLGGPGGQRADVIMLLHIAEGGDRAVLVSIPRDLRVEVPGLGLTKINAAFASSKNGAERMIKTVRRFTGLTINHFVSVNFQSFRGIVDAVNGVTIHTKRKLEDDKSKLDIPGPGCWTLEGDMALAYVRARNIDPTADIGRIQRQQGFLRALAARVKQAGVLLRPDRLIRLSDEVGKGLRYDPGLKDFGRARAIAARLAGFDDRKMDFRIVPNYPAYINGISYLIPREEQAAALFDAIGRDGKLPGVGKTAQTVPKRKDVSVKVLNGTDRPGLAGEETGRLRELGFRMSSPGDAPSRKRTILLYEAATGELRADLVLRYFPGAEVRAVNRDLAVDVLVKLGADQVEASPSATPSPAQEAPAPDKTCRRL